MKRFVAKKRLSNIDSFNKGKEEHELFDWKFYDQIYPDVREYCGEISKDIAFRHWILHGRAEGRVHNKYVMEQKREGSLRNAISELNKVDITCSEEAVTFNILIRTHLRPSSFDTCIRSVLSQTYNNVRVIVSYDHPDCLDYLRKYPNIETFYVSVDSKQSCSFNLYCNYLLDKVEKGWILFLDDDDLFIHPEVLRVINQTIKNDNEAVLWKFLRPDKTIYPKDIANIEVGEVDTSSFCFSSAHKNKARWGDRPDSDYHFFCNLVQKAELFIKPLPLILVSTIYDSQVSHYEDYGSHHLTQHQSDIEKFKNIRIDENRIDFKDYLEHYSDLKEALGDDVEKARQHWLKHGRDESRVVRIRDVDYKKLRTFMNSLFYQGDIREKFTLLTSLYNETTPNRKTELILSLEHNIQNELIQRIVVFYDSGKGTDEEVLQLLNETDKIDVIHTDSRPYFYQMMKMANSKSNELFIIANSDIVFDQSLNLVSQFYMKNKLFALTRWDFTDEETIKPRIQNNKIMGSSQDAWIFRSPVNLDEFRDTEFEKIQLGTWNCDCALNHFFLNSSVQILNPCLDIKVLHVHFSNNRSYNDSKIEYACEIEGLPI